MLQPKWRQQYAALMRKHWLQAKRNWLGTAVQLFMGLFVCLLLMGFQGIANYVLSVQTPHPAAVLVQAPPLCTPGRDSVGLGPDGQLVPGGCNTLLFGPASPTVVRVMQRMASNTGLEYGKDVALLPGLSQGPPFDLHLVNASLSNSTSCVAGGCGFVPSFECLPCAIVRDNATITSFLLDHGNSTQNLAWFVGSYTAGLFPGENTDLSYNLAYNFSQTIYPWYFDSHSSSVKKAIDTAIVELAAEDRYNVSSSSLDLKVYQRGFPKPVPRVTGYQVFASNGGQWVFLVPCILFFNALTDIVSEKESRLRVSMTMMGLRVSAYWAAQLSTALIMGFLSSLVLIASGFALQFDFFLNTNVFALFLLFFLFNIAMLCLAVFLSAFLSASKTAQTVGYSIILLGFVLQFLLTSAYAALVDLLFSDRLEAWVYGVRRLLTLYPAFNFSLFFYDISSLASSTLDLNEGKLVKGPGFFWSSMTQSRERDFAGFHCLLPAPAQSVFLMLMDAAIFLVLGLYFDAVLPGPAGSPKHPLFFLGCKYRPLSVAAPSSPSSGGSGGGATAGVAAADTSSMTALDRLKAGLIDIGVEDEQRRAAALSGTLAAREGAAPVLRVSRLRVVYRKGWSAFLFALTGVDASTWSCACLGRRHHHHHHHEEDPASPRRSKGGKGGSAKVGASNAAPNGDVLAVNDVSFTIKKGEIFGLLGHNGAGKTTVIAASLGLQNAASGEIEIAGKDIVADRDEALKCVGVCPQFDCLWPFLTAAETLTLFASLRGIAPSALEAEVSRLLHDVKLFSVKDRQVAGFSGGMRRRVSLAIATIGKPDLILIDEGSAGLDPVSRNRVFRLIQRLKKSSAILLTTHNLQEANALATRIGVMALGRLVALGTPLRLKTQYGSGYRLNTVLRDASEEVFSTVLRGIQAIVPSASVALRDASNVAFSIPNRDIVLMPALLDWCETEAAVVSARGPSDTAPLPTTVPEAIAAAIEDGGSGGTFSARADDGDYSPLRNSSNDNVAAAVRAAPESSIPLIKEHGVSGPTLESTFISISAAANFDLAQATTADVSSGADADGAKNGGGDEDEELDEEERRLLPKNHKHRGGSKAGPRRKGSMAPPQISMSLNADEEPSPSFVVADWRGGSLAIDTEGKSSGRCCKRRGPCFPQCCYRGGFYALLAKNLTLLQRQRGLCLCQILTPLLVLGFLVLLQWIIQVEAGGNTTMVVPSLLVPLNQNQLYPVTQSIPANPSDSSNVPNSSDDDDRRRARRFRARQLSGSEENNWASVAASSGAELTRTLVQLLTERQISVHSSAVESAARATEDVDEDNRGDEPDSKELLFSRFLDSGRRMARKLGGRRGKALNIFLTWIEESTSFSTPLAPTTMARKGSSPSPAREKTSLAAAATPTPQPSPPPYPSGSDTDCLTFFLFSADNQQLAASIGANPRVTLPSPAPSPLPRPSAISGNASFGLLGSIATNWCSLKNRTLVSAPFFSPRFLPAATSPSVSVSDSETESQPESQPTSPFLRGLRISVDGEGSPLASDDDDNDLGPGSAAATLMDDELLSVINLLNNASTQVLDYQPPCWKVTSFAAATAPDGWRFLPSLMGSFGAGRLPTVVKDGDDPYDPVTERWLCPAYLLPDASLNFHAYSPLQLQQRSSLGDSNDPTVTGSLSFTVQINDLPLTKYHRPNNFTRLGFAHIPSYIGKRALTVEPGKLSLMDSLLRAYYKESGLATGASALAAGGAGDGTNAAATNDDAVVMPSISLVGTFPDIQVQDLLSFVEIVGAIIFPIALSLQLPLFVFVTVLEKEERLVELQRVMGMKLGSYIIVNYATNFFLFCLVASAFWICGKIMDFRLFSQTAPGVLAFAFIGWGLALCSMAQLLSSFLWSRRAATVLGYVVCLFGSLWAILIAAGLYGQQLGFNLGPMPVWIFAVGPQFGLVRFLYLTSFECIGKQSCPPSLSWALSPGNELGPALASMYLHAAVMLVLSLYLDEVLPKRYGVSRHPLFCLPRSWKRVMNVENSGGESESASLSADDTAASSPPFFRYLRRWAKYLPSLLVAPSSSAASHSSVSSAGIPSSPTASSSGVKPLANPPLPPFISNEEEAMALATRDYAKGEDEDVQAERARVEMEIWPRAMAARRTAANSKRSGTSNIPSAGIFSEFPVVIHHLRKEFPVPASKKLPAGATVVAAPVAAGPIASAKNAQLGLVSSSGGLSSLQEPLLGPSSSSSSVLHANTAGALNNDASASGSFPSSSSGTLYSPSAIVPVLSRPYPFSPASAATDPSAGPSHPTTSSSLASTFSPRRGQDLLLSGPVYEEREQQLLASRGIKVAVSDLTLALERGQTFGLLGENGCGKTTSMSMLMGLYPPTGGAAEALINGRSCSKETDLARKSLGVCLQQDIVWPNLTCEEHLRFYARMKGVMPAPSCGGDGDGDAEDALQQHVREGLTRVGLIQFADRKASDLSGGMRRRLSLAIAMAGDSKLLLLDEISAGLDPSTKRRIWRVIERSKRDRVVILVSHDLVEVETLSDRIGIMSFGRLRALGTPLSLKEKYGGGYLLSLNFQPLPLFASGSTGAAAASENELIPHAAAMEDDAQAKRRVINFIRSFFPLAQVEESFTGFLSFTLPFHAATALPSANGGAAASSIPALPPALKLSALFALMSAKAGSAGITDWQIGQVSLDTVFGRIVRHYRAGGRDPTEEEEDDDDDDAEKENDMKADAGRAED